MDGSNQWYMAIGGHQVGPVSQQEIITNLQNGSIDAETLVFTAGMAQWQKVKDVPAFAAYVKGAGGALRRARAPARSRRRRRRAAARTTSTSRSRQRDAVRRGRARSGRRRGRRSRRDDVHDAGHRDGDDLRRRQPAAPSGVMDALLGAGKRLLTGESLFMTVFTNQRQRQAARSRSARRIPARSSRWICARSADS